MLDSEIQNNSIISLASENLNSSIKNIKSQKSGSKTGENRSVRMRSKEQTISNGNTLQILNSVQQSTAMDGMRSKPSQSVQMVQQRKSKGDESSLASQVNQVSQVN